MNCNFDYGELLVLSCALHRLEIVYGDNEARTPVMEKVDALLDQMNNSPIDQLYPGLVSSIQTECEGVGTIIT